MMNSENKYSSDRFPLPGETCAYIVGNCYKRAALLFDKIHVYRFPNSELSEVEDGIPESITFGVAGPLLETKETIRKDIYRLLQLIEGFANDVANHFDIKDRWNLEEDPNLDKRFIELIDPFSAGNAEEILIEMKKDIEKNINDFYVNSKTQAAISAYSDCGITAIPCFEKLDLYNADYPSGPILVYQAALANLPIVEEKETSWKQIIQFREDAEAARKYRALRMWLHQGLKANSVKEATEIIGKKLDDYEWAIKKHGLNTTKGAITQILELNKAGKTLAMAGVAALVGGPIWSAIIMGMVITSHISISLIDRKIELENIKRGEHSEVALIYDARKAFEK